MRRVSVAFFAFASFALLAPITMQALSDCAALNAARGEGKFTGQISNQPDGSSMEVSYGGQSVIVHYNSSVTVCEGGQPASVSALTRGASVSVFGPLRRTGSSVEINAARIFVAGPPQTARSSSGPALPRVQPAQPRRTSETLLPNSAILRGGTHTETMQRLRVVRTYAMSDLRTNSQVRVGEARLDLQPMLSNPKALFNVAQRLRAMPQHVQVQEESSEVSEVEQGLVIHHVLTYRILPGKCSDPSAKAQLASAGVDCFTRVPTAERLAEFSRPGTPRYVADPQKREIAIAAFQRNSAQADVDATNGIADLKKALADPTQRAAIVAQVGQAETARLSTLNDDQLKEEVINASVQRYEETMFVPKVESANYAHVQHTLAIAPRNGEMAATQQLLRDGVPEHGYSPANFPKLLKVISSHPVLPSGGGKTGDLDLGPYIFLTGSPSAMITSGNGASRLRSTGALLAARPPMASNCTPGSTTHSDCASPFARNSSTKPACAEIPLKPD